MSMNVSGSSTPRPTVVETNDLDVKTNAESTSGDDLIINMPDFEGMEDPQRTDDKGKEPDIVIRTDGQEKASQAATDVLDYREYVGEETATDDLPREPIVVAPRFLPGWDTPEVHPVAGPGAGGGGPGIAGVAPFARCLRTLGPPLAGILMFESLLGLAGGSVGSYLGSQYGSPSQSVPVLTGVGATMGVLLGILCLASSPICFLRIRNAGA